VVKAPEDQLRAAMCAVEGVIAVHAAGASSPGEVGIIVEALPDREIRPVLARAITEKGWDLLEMRTVHASLEDVFIDLVTEEPVEESSGQAANQKEVA